MARMKRIVVQGYPHHVVQRGVRSLNVFFDDQDRVEYLRLLREQGNRFGVTFLSYCLMANHVHLPAVPEKQDGLARAIGEAHRRYTRMINFRENVRGFLFQGRFSSCLVDSDAYLVAAMQYIERNPVKAKIVNKPWEYPWSSAEFHCGVVKDDPLVQKVLSIDTDLHGILEEKNRTGRPFGADHFYTVVEK